MSKVCTSCGFVGTPTSITKGSFLIEVFLWIMLIVPGIIYSLWRLTSRFDACPKCQSPNMIPADSPVAKQFLAGLKTSKADA